jgi:hypothetical protein
MAQNMGLIFDSLEQVYGEIDVLYSSQGCDPPPVNQRVAGSSPADGAIYSKPQGRGVSVSPSFFGNSFGKTQKGSTSSNAIPLVIALGFSSLRLTVSR